MLLSGGYVSYSDGVVEYEIYADVNKYNGNAYYSMGLSADNKMGEISMSIYFIGHELIELLLWLAILQNSLLIIVLHHFYLKYYR